MGNGLFMGSFSLVQASSVAHAPPEKCTEAVWQSRLPDLFPAARAHGICARGEAGLGGHVETWSWSRELSAGLVLHCAGVLDLSWVGSSTDPDPWLVWELVSHDPTCAGDGTVCASTQVPTLVAQISCPGPCR